MPLTNEEAKRKLEVIVARGECVSVEKLRDLVEPEHIGEFLSLEPDSGGNF